MTLRATITNGNTSDLAPLYTTTLLISRGVGVEEQSSRGICAGVAPSTTLTGPHPMPLF